MKRWLRTIMSLIFLMQACHSHSTSPDASMTYGVAAIEQIELLFSDSSPVQVRVRINGVLGDSCTMLDRITQTREEQVFIIRVFTERPTEMICAAMIQEFDEVVTLETSNLAAGEYLVDVNGVRDTFTLGN